jgi:hypothetical protein
MGNGKLPCDQPGEPDPLERAVDPARIMLCQ